MHTLSLHDALPICFTSNDIELFIVLSILVASNLIPYIRAKSESYGITNKAGITARPERVIFAVIFMFFDLDYVFMYIFSLLCWITVFQRIKILITNLDK